MIEFLLTIAVAYTALLAFVYWYQPRLVFLPNVAGRALVASPSDLGLAHEDLGLRTSDGVRLHAWYVPADNARATVLFFHGNAGNISHRLDTLEIFHELGLNVLMPEYRGYGQSEGKPSERGTRRDALAAWNYLVDERGVQAGEIVLFGRSLGGAVAAQLAGARRPAGLVLESSFTSVPDIGAELYPWLPVRWLSRIRYDTASVLPELDIPVLIIHSPEDDIIPYRHGEALFTMAREPRSFLRIGGGHNGGYMLDRPTYVAGLEAFLASLQSAASTQAR